MFIAATAAARAEGFECAPLQPSKSRAPAYGIDRTKTRCEGFFERNVSQPFIELLSLTRGPVPASATATPSAALEIHADVGAPLRLLVQPQRSAPFYRVDAAMQGGQPLRWDPAPMLAATGLRLGDLGFLALAGQATPGAVTMVAPVALGAQSRQLGRLHAVLRVSVAVSSVAWRAYRLQADAAPATVWSDVPDSRLYAWQRLTLPIDLPAGDKGLGIDVQAVAASDARPLPLLRFAIMGSGDAAPAR